MDTIHIRVNNAYVSEAIQRIAFSFGYEWPHIGKVPSRLHETVLCFNTNTKRIFVKTDKTDNTVGYNTLENIIADFKRVNHKNDYFSSDFLDSMYKKYEKSEQTKMMCSDMISVLISNEATSEAIQWVAFSFGYEWPNIGKVVSHTKSNVLFFNTKTKTIYNINFSEEDFYIKMYKSTSSVVLKFYETV